MDDVGGRARGEHGRRRTAASTTTRNGSRASWPADATGAGLHEAPRGALGHWVHIHNGLITNYQCVVPSTWNAGPRDAKGRRGPYEEALIGTPVADPERPIEILRTVHSFDPCMACGVHVVDAARRETGAREGCMSTAAARPERSSASTSGKCRCASRTGSSRCPSSSCR